MERMELQMFCKHTNLYEDDPLAMLAFVDYIDQDLLLNEWWAIYKEDYV
jgi:hypothetical protein